MIGNGIMEFADALPDIIREVGNAVCDVRLQVAKTDMTIAEMRKPQ